MTCPFDILCSDDRDQFFHETGESLRRTGELKQFAEDIANSTRATVRGVLKQRGKHLAASLKASSRRMELHEWSRLIKLRTFHACHDACCTLYDQLGIQYQPDDLGLWLNTDEGSEPDREVEPDRFRSALESAFESHAPWERYLVLWTISTDGFHGWQNAAGTLLPEYSCLVEDDSGNEEQSGLDATEEDVDDSLPESFHFTSLDTMLIDQIVIASLGQPGCMSQLQVANVAEEIASLNKDRPVSWFNVGFSASIFDFDFIARAGSDNEVRRAWWLAGWIMGRIRKADNKVVVVKELIRFDERDRDTLLTSKVAGSHEIGRMVVDTLFSEMLEEDHAEAAAWLRLCPIINHEIFSQVESCIHSGRLDAARALMKAIKSSVDADWNHGGEEDFADTRSSMAMLHDLLDIIYSRANSDFGRASRLINQFRSKHGVEDFDLRLREESLRVKIELASPERLSIIDQSRHDAMASRIQQCKTEFDDLFDSGSIAPDLQAASAVPVLADAKADRESLSRARDRLDSAIEIYGDEDSRMRDRLLFWRLILSVRMKGGSDLESDISRLIETLRGSDDLHLPINLLLPVLGEAVLQELPKLDELVLELLDDDLHSSYSASLRKSDAMPLLVERPEVQKWILDTEGGLEGLEVRTRLDILRSIMSCRNEQSPKVCDALLEMAYSYPDRAADEACQIIFEFNPDRFMDEDEMLVIQCSLLRLAGRRPEALEFVRNRAMKCIERRDALAEDMIDMFTDYGGAAEQAAVMRQNIQTIEPIEPAPSKMHHINVLLVGGDDAIRAKQADIKKHVRAALHSRVKCSITFEHPGWSSNWGRKLNRVRKLIEANDVVVTHYRMRTMFGRRLRSMIGSKTWRGSQSDAAPSIARTIVKATHAAIANDEGRILEKVEVLQR